jgi:soluble lytic murein transglycosylase
MLLASVLFFVAVFSAFQPALAQRLLGSDDVALYRQAFAALDSGRGQDAVALASRATDRTLYEVVYGLSLAAADSTADFATYERTLNSPLNWPKAERKVMAKMAERHITGDVPPQRVLAFFAQNDVQTVEGLQALVAAYDATRQPAKGAAAVRDIWRSRAMAPEEQQKFLPVFSRYLSAADTAARADMLVWARKFSMAQDLFPQLAADQRTLISARIALAKMEKNAPRLMDKVAGHLQNDPGLLYERMRWRRKKDDMEGALAMMQRAARNLGHADEWWDERQMLARGLIDKGKYREAYNLVAAHGTDKGSPYAEAEFLCGWLSLRYLDNPRAALTHFTRLYNQGETPITLSRGAYWLGRTHQVLGTPGEASRWYSTAAAFGTSYYGQLAANALYPTSQISAIAPTISEPIRRQFAAYPHASIIIQLLQAGGNGAAEDFALAWANNMTTEQEFRLLADMGLQLGDPDLAVKVSKVAARKKILLPVEGYPILQVGTELQNVSLAHAITRQESQFDARVVSPSNAQGLMQLLPGTAREVAGKMGIGNGYDVFDPSTNMQLGSFYINNMLEHFEGSLPLAVAAYNAGPGRVRQWLGSMGDPRGGRMDMIDWVERIPFNETRNYVQRVLEALQIYRAKFSGGTAMLGLAQDLNGHEQAVSER